MKQHICLKKRILSETAGAVLRALVFTLAAVLLSPALRLSVHAKNLVIVIDPGHGGENEGAIYDGYTEKEMTLIVARAMKEELEKCEGVEVWLTRESDVDMKIIDRAAFAAQKNADFLFCLHFNTSENRNYYGAEVWVPSKGEYYARGYSFAQLEMQELTGLGLYSRGIKTRLDKLGNDYYGILRYCSREGVPSALIEHCHLDHEKDKPFYQQSQEQLREFGRLDARAAARYFGLSSDFPEMDFGGYGVPQTDVPAQSVKPDRTPPQLCRIKSAQVSEETGEITVCVEAQDAESYILYYGYSLDGGETYSPLEEWPRPQAWNQSAKEHTFTITAPFDRELQLCVKVFNGFDLDTRSETLSIPSIPDPERIRRQEQSDREKALQEAQKGYREIHYGDELQKAEDDFLSLSGLNTGQLGAAIGLILLLILVLSFVMARMIFLLIKPLSTKLLRAKGNKKQ